MAILFPRKIRLCWQTSRPFTLLMPFVGFISAALISYKVSGNYTGLPYFYILTGALSAAILNAASNSLNQIYDIDIDRINKPERPIAKGTLGKNEAWAFTLILYLAAIFFASILPNKQFFLIVMFTAACTFLYSVPPVRFKKRFVLSNLIIAFMRGPLLFAAGWSAVQKINTAEPWFIGGIFGIFLIGASATKDFSDIEGDRKFACKTLPVIIGVEKTIKIISPFLIVPFFIFPLGVIFGILHCSIFPLILLSVFFACWGSFIVFLLHKESLTLAIDSNHISWKHMYLMLISAQIGIALAYLI